MTKLSIEDYETYIAPLIAECAKKDCSEYWEITRNLRQSKGIPEDKKEIITLFDAVVSYYLVPNSPNEPFKPYIIMDGRRSSIPDDLTDEERDYLQEVLPKIKDSELRARVADTLWILKHGQAQKHAKVAIESYLLSAHTLLEEHWFNTKDRLIRALRIFVNARLSKQKNVPKKLDVPKKIFKYIKDSNTPHRLVVDLIEVLHEAGHPDNMQNAKILEAIATTYETEKHYEPAGNAWRLVAKLYAREKMTDDATRCQINAAETYVKIADIMEAVDKPFYAQVCHYLRGAVEAYRSISCDRKRPDEIYARLVHAQKNIPHEAQPLSTEVNIFDSSEQARKHVSGQNTFTALCKFAFIIHPPNYEEVKNDLREKESKYPLSTLIPTQYHDDKGRAVGRASMDEDDDLKMHRLVAQFYRGIPALSILIPALEQIRLEHNISLLEWKSLLENHPFIPPERMKAYAYGLFHGFHSDFFSAAHVLIPQIENSIRYILNNHGKQTSKQINESTQEEDSFKNALASKELEELLGKDLVFDLQGLLVIKEGVNLRNNLMHGLLDDNRLFAPDIVYLYWLTLHIIISLRH